MTFISWLSLASICLLGAMSPGPSLALIITNSVEGGVRCGINTAVGHGIGIALYALLVALGLGLIITNTLALLSTIKICGALFLLYLAYQAITSKRSESTLTTTRRQRRGFGGGFIVALINPKIALFFIALFAQFVNAQMSWLDKGIMVTTAGVIDALWYSVVAVGISTTPLLPWLRRNQLWVNRATALTLTLIAIQVLR
jgi:threonine/homoserine/homoserine lactone efflux protein